LEAGELDPKVPGFRDLRSSLRMVLRTVAGRRMYQRITSEYENSGRRKTCQAKKNDKVCQYCWKNNPGYFRRVCRRLKPTRVFLMHAYPALPCGATLWRRLRRLRRTAGIRLCPIACCFGGCLAFRSGGPFVSRLRRLRRTAGIRLCPIACCLGGCLACYPPHSVRGFALGALRQG
jgi:hypothetical protein